MAYDRNWRNLVPFLMHDKSRLQDGGSLIKHTFLKIMVNGKHVHKLYFPFSG